MNIDVPPPPSASVRPRADLSFVGLEAADDSAVLAAFAERALAVGAVLPSFATALVDRERAYPTGLPTVIPVAIPHADVEHVLEPGLGIAVLAHPVAFGEMGGAESTVLARVVVLILVTEPHEQVDLLVRLIAVFQLDGWFETLAATNSPAELTRAFSTLLDAAPTE